MLLSAIRKESSETRKYLNGLYGGIWQINWQYLTKDKNYLIKYL